MPIRCFKSIETEIINYTVTYIQDDDEPTTVSAVYGEHLVEPSPKDK
jgi:hypothetical protein